MRKPMYILIVLILLVSSIAVSANTEISLYLNNSEIPCDVAPIIVNGRTLVPARALFEPLGAKLKWNGLNRQAIVTMDDTEIRFTIGSLTARVNGEKYKLDCAPILVDGRTLFPARFVAEQLKYDVDWDNDSRSVLITTPTPDKNKITAVDYSFDDETVTVKIVFSDELSDYSDYYLSEPTRLILELDNCVYDTGNVEIGVSGIERARMANHPDYFKIVFDMEDELKYDIKQSSNKKKLTLTISSDENTEITAPPDEDEEEENIPAEPFPGDPIIVIDPGHGGSDPGAIAYDDNDEIYAKEKDINLGIATYLCDILESEGITTYMTRTDDTYVPLSQRASYANSMNADLFVSIHNNSHTRPDISGILTLYSEDKDAASGGLQDSKSVAANIQEKMVSAIGKNSQGIRSEDELYVLRNTKMTAVLVEVLYMSNKEDVEYTSQDKNQRIVARAIADGIIASLKKDD